eukprot:scaffold292128_cov47-Attheya_sp.AAC.1
MFGLKLHKFFIPNFPWSRPPSLLRGNLLIMMLCGNLVLMTSVLSLVSLVDELWFGTPGVAWPKNVLASVDRLHHTVVVDVVPAADDDDDAMGTIRMGLNDDLPKRCETRAFVLVKSSSIQRSRAVPVHHHSSCDAVAVAILLDHAQHQVDTPWCLLLSRLP